MGLNCIFTAMSMVQVWGCACSPLVIVLWISFILKSLLDVVQQVQPSLPSRTSQQLACSQRASDSTKWSKFTHLPLLQLCWNECPTHSFHLTPRERSWCWEPKSPLWHMEVRVFFCGVVCHREHPSVHGISLQL